MCDTPSHGSDHLWLIWKESIHNCRCYRADTAGWTDGRTDEQTDGVKPIYPQQLRCSGGIIIQKIYILLPYLYRGWKYTILNLKFVIGSHVMQVNKETHLSIILFAIKYFVHFVIYSRMRRKNNLLLCCKPVVHSNYYSSFEVHGPELVIYL